MQILFETQQLVALKTSFARKCHDKYPIFWRESIDLEHVHNWYLEPICEFVHMLK